MAPGARSVSWRPVVARGPVGRPGGDLDGPVARVRIDEWAAGAGVDGRHAPVAVDAARGGAGAGGPLVDDVGVVEDGSGHGHELEAGSQAAFRGGQFADASEQDDGHVERHSELPGLIEEVGLFVGVGVEEPVSDEPEPGTQIPRQRCAELAVGAAPLKRYMGLARELPPVNTRASRPPSASRKRATWMLSSIVSPPR